MTETERLRALLDASMTYTRRSLSDVNRMVELTDMLAAENAKLRELVRGLHMAYIGIINQCESFDTSLTWEFSSDIDADLAKQHASYEQDRHRFDVAMRELGVEVEG
jgi:hypothetical protein